MIMNRRPPVYVFDTGARAVVLALALLLAVPAVGSFFADEFARSAWENRPLAEAPYPFGPVRNLGFTAALDQYLNDHFGFALEINRLYRQLLYYAFRDSPSPDLTVGTDGFLFLTGASTGRPYEVLEALCVGGQTAAIVPKAIANWQSTFTYFDRKGYRTVLAIIPPKPVVYPEKLPASVPRRYREACAQYRPETSLPGALERAFEGTGHVVVYPFAEFKAHRYEGNFYPRENFHSNGESANLTARLVLAQMGISVDESFTRAALVEESSRDLQELLGFERTVHAKLYSYATYGVVSHFRSPELTQRFYHRARAFGTYTAAHPVTTRTALVIGNSFVTNLARDLAPAFRSLVWVQTNDLQDQEGEAFFSEFVDAIHPDDIIFVLHDTGLINLAYQDWPTKLLSAKGQGHDPVTR